MLLGGLAYAYREPLMEAAGIRNALGQYSATYLRREVPCPAPSARTLVVVPLGQSNAGSSAQGVTAALPNVVNFLDGRCFRAEDPLLGTDGAGTSPWIAFANTLAEKHDHVVLAPFTVGGSSIVQWNGDIGNALGPALAALGSKLRVTHVLWQQGETDIAMTATEYADRLRKVIALTRAAAPSAAFYVAIASRCGRSPRENGVRSGQMAVIDPGAGILRGPDTDVIDERYDRCHFSDAGRLQAAALWVKAITPPSGAP